MPETPSAAALVIATHVPVALHPAAKATKGKPRLTPAIKAKIAELRLAGLSPNEIVLRLPAFGMHAAKSTVWTYTRGTELAEENMRGRRYRAALKTAAVRADRFRPQIDVNLLQAKVALNRRQRTAANWRVAAAMLRALGYTPRFADFDGSFNWIVASLPNGDVKRFVIRSPRIIPSTGRVETKIEFANPKVTAHALAAGVFSPLIETGELCVLPMTSDAPSRVVSHGPEDRFAFATVGLVDASWAPTAEFWERVVAAYRRLVRRGHELPIDTALMAHWTRRARWARQQCAA